MITLKQRLQTDELIRICAVGRLAHHNLIHLIGLAGGYQGVWLDMEHVGLTTHQIEILTLAARAHQLDTFCRIAPTDYAIVTRCLEAGAGGVMAAQIHSAAQAEEFVKWCKFAPRGCRGLNTGGWDAGFTTISAKEFVKKANDEQLVLIQIETPGSLDEVEAIAAIEGVDGLFVGPADLSQSLGVTGEFFHEKCVAALDRIAAACRQAGKPWAAVSFNAAHADLLLSRGCRMISPTTDNRVVLAGLQAIQKDYANLFSPTSAQGDNSRLV